MNTMILMMGIQGSGKSEFCRQYLAGKYVRVNLDTLNTRNNERKLIEECFAKKQDFVVDNTNPAKSDRERYIPWAKEHGYCVVGYFMQFRLQECIARNNMREGKAKIPAMAVAATSNKLEMPSIRTVTGCLGKKGFQYRQPPSSWRGSPLHIKMSFFSSMESILTNSHHGKRGE